MQLESCIHHLLYELTDPIIIQRSIQGERIRSGKKILPISVNLSRASIHYDNMICRYVKIVEENGIPFSSVPIELTETAGSSLS